MDNVKQAGPHDGHRGAGGGREQSVMMMMRWWKGKGGGEWRGEEDASVAPLDS